MTWWTIYDNALTRGEYPAYAEHLADEWAKRKGKQNDNPVVPIPRDTRKPRDLRVSCGDCHREEHGK